MTTFLAFLLLGVGSGAVFALLGVGIVVTYRVSRVINFAQGAFALYGAYTYAGLRDSGELFNPIVGLPKSVHVADNVSMAVAMAIAVAVTALLGVVMYFLVFRWLRERSEVIRLVASVGLMLFIPSLIGLRLGTSPVTVEPIFPRQSFTLGHSRVLVDRLYFGATALVLTAAVVLLYNYTGFGRRTRALAESNKGAAIVGFHVQRLPAVNWGISGAFAGITGVLIAPIASLTPGTYTLFVIPALAVALLGRFSSLWWPAVAGIALGATQSGFSYLQTQSWFPTDFQTGAAEVVPLVVIIGVLIARRRSLPSRGALPTMQLPRSPRPENLWFGLPGLSAVGIVGLVTLQGGYRSALISSMIIAILALSIVVITGYAGQVSLTQLALAGLSAFLLSRATSSWHIPFPLTIVLVATLAMLVGVIVGIPALRVRGINLSIVSLAAADAIAGIYFNNPDLTGGSGSAPISGPTLFGLDLRIASGGHFPSVSFGIVVLICLVACALFVASLRRSRLGSYMLAIRDNERAAAAAGIDVERVKVIAFAISAFCAGIAGALLAYQSRTVTAESFDVLTGVQIFAIAYLSGVTSITGALVCGIIAPLGVVSTLLDRTFGFGPYYEVVAGGALVLMALLHPVGIAGTLHDAAEGIRARRSRSPSRPERGGRHGGSEDADLPDGLAISPAAAGS